MDKKLYKLLIVDDEYLIRELLEKIIDWEQLGCKIVGKASCSTEVYDFLDEHTVDIIITDINMPVVDGITMSKVIKKQHPKIKLIILTGYDDFEYAKNSIKIGIDDYILKPINEDELSLSVLKVIEKIEKETKREYEYKNLKEQLQQNIPYLKEKFFLELLHNTINSHDIHEKEQFFGLKLQTEFFQVSLIQLSIPSSQIFSEEEKFIMLFRIKNIIEQNFKNFKNIQILLDNQDHIVVISYNKQINMLEELNYLLKIIRQNITWDINISLGGVKKSIETIQISYKEALTALKYKIILGNNLIFHYNDMQVINNIHSDLPNINENELNELKFLIKAGLKDKAITHINKLYDKISIYNNLDEKSYISYVRVQTTRILSTLYYMLTLMNIKIIEITKENNYFKDIYTIKTIPSAKKLVIQFVEKIINYINNIQTNNVDNFIRDIEKYINKRISTNELTLKKTANHFYMNPSYLSRIYKQKKGISFKEYINKIRMEKAIELLRNTDLKVYEIGERIGIPDPNYFSSYFKKFMGISISEYKKLILKE